MTPRSAHESARFFFENRFIVLISARPINPYSPPDACVSDRHFTHFALCPLFFTGKVSVFHTQMLMRSSLDAHSILDAGLVSGDLLWRPKPFHDHRVAWRVTHPGLHRKILSLSDAELAEVQHSQSVLHELVGEYEPSFAPMSHVSREIDAGAQASFNPSASLRKGDSRAHIGVPGKKWQQVRRGSGARTSQRSPTLMQ